MFDEFKIKLIEDLITDRIQILIFRNTGYANIQYLTKDFEVKEHSTTKIFDDQKSLIQLPNTILQQLSNSLSKLGINPEKIKESESELKAIKNHLNDMRSLVFKEKLY